MHSFYSNVFIIAFLLAITHIQAAPVKQAQTTRMKNIRKLFSTMETENEYARFLSHLKIERPQNPQMQARYDELFSLNAYVSDLAEIYETSFTDEEITKLIMFYSTPLGKKTIHFNKALTQMMEPALFAKINEYIVSSIQNGFDVPLHLVE